MKLEYCHSETFNFGDDLNPWLWPKLLGDTFDDNTDSYFLGIGTILTKKRINERLKEAKRIIIFSSGAWDEELPTLDERCQVFGVRGPRTAEKLGLSPDLAIGDGAYLLRKVALPVPEKKSGIGFIPHHRSEDFVDWQSVCDSAGLKFISAKQPVEDFLLDLQGCEKVVTEAMHGAIVADALRIPWIPVKFSPAFNEEKWYDFAESMNLNISFETLPFMSKITMPIGKMLENAIKRGLSRYLSCPVKWSRLPVVFKSASSQELKELSDSLHKLSLINGILSDEKHVNFITEQQFAIVQDIKKSMRCQ
ncbi:polysaccharide pyruvyl transferase family protein [Photobacterium aphoticum]|uniref:Succinoglycan biosynthesis protein exov n=1 Tax=Photobacterium aphoticum TaxID=754436 RepID=A0A0J1GJ27_9GAMM|nr:polysaccharide pyruvyl transferase family protein [Photobacterium aphoticum]KLU99674.1 succinoglycan biosynthesis protein exov [Photobacterium aphoticum]PSU55279.1 succinoglycan biosynthesis protein exov [Photobacterium aphoticum]GHA43885.1 succinoglycan biosynthesis protein exov [Photobacterium aphoticum]